MFNLEIFYVGGTSSIIAKVSEEFIKKFKTWLDDDLDNQAFHVDFNKGKRGSICK